jgi:hypothetical protein
MTLPSPATCRGATSACIATPARQYHRWPGNEVVVLCDPCAERLREMGLGLERHEPPEWIRRAADGRLPVKDYSGAAR